MTKRRDAEDRRQQRLRRLGTRDPCCGTCGETDPAVLERHHIAGRKYSEDTTTVCLNCHRKLSDKQRDHIPPGQKEIPGPLTAMGHYLLGLADLLAMVVEALRKLGARLIGKQIGAVTP